MCLTFPSERPIWSLTAWPSRLLTSSIGEAMVVALPATLRSTLAGHRHEDGVRALPRREPARPAEQALDARPSLPSQRVARARAARAQVGATWRRRDIDRRRVASGTPS